MNDRRTDSQARSDFGCRILPMSATRTSVPNRPGRRGSSAPESRLERRPRARANRRDGNRRPKFSCTRYRRRSADRGEFRQYEHLRRDSAGCVSARRKSFAHQRKSLAERARLESGRWDSNPRRPAWEDQLSSRRKPPELVGWYWFTIIRRPVQVGARDSEEMQEIALGSSLEHYPGITRIMKISWFNNVGLVTESPRPRARRLSGHGTFVPLNDILGRDFQGRGSPPNREDGLDRDENAEVEHFAGWAQGGLIRF